MNICRGQASLAYIKDIFAYCPTNEKSSQHHANALTKTCRCKIRLCKSIRHNENNEIVKLRAFFSNEKAMHNNFGRCVKYRRLRLICVACGIMLRLGLVMYWRLMLFKYKTPR
ncbi:hypothetical protein [Thermoplasma volcanium GSS1]|uniref:Uncharacterized protein n=1 Tax=Thermoplasma volcanium (strain ATCC 51530 / DSM 4299 / JCM 9571 / NBRC 15438 / GSS1) TaxID=273116 RepID=Q97A70_THEVO|nr:hypothetical protein [Thermoplasma volcanium GSS1]